MGVCFVTCFNSSLCLVFAFHLAEKKNIPVNVFNNWFVMTNLICQLMGSWPSPSVYPPTSSWPRKRQLKLSLRSHLQSNTNNMTKSLKFINIKFYLPVKVARQAKNDADTILCCRMWQHWGGGLLLHLAWHVADHPGPLRVPVHPHADPQSRATQPWRGRQVSRLQLLDIFLIGGI